MATHHWETADPEEEVGTYHSGGGFERMLPMVLIRRNGDATLDRVVQLIKAEADAAQTSYVTELSRLQPQVSAAQVDIYDLGMATLTVDLTISTTTDVDYAELANQIKRAVWLRPVSSAQDAPPLAAALRRLASECAHQFSSAVAAVCCNARQRPWLRSVGADDSHRDIGRLLWLHPVNVVRTDNQSAHEPISRQLAPAFCRHISLPGARFVTGIGWSAIVLTRDSDSDLIAMRLIQMHYAYIALYMEIDRGLLQALEDDRWRHDQHLHRLEADADEVFGNFMRVMEARARIDTALAELGGDEQATWEAMNQVSRLDTVIDGVDRKVEVLQKVAERRVQQATAAAARRTTAILSFLTALTVVTVSVALIGNFIGNRSDQLGHLDLRLLVVGIALVTAIAVYLEAFRDRSTRRSRRHPRSGRDRRL